MRSAIMSRSPASRDSRQRATFRKHGSASTTRRLASTQPTSLTTRRVYPFGYAAGDSAELARVHRTAGAAARNRTLGRGLPARRTEPADTHALLAGMTQTIKRTFRHGARHQKGTQDPLQTLQHRERQLPRSRGADDRGAALARFRGAVRVRLSQYRRSDDDSLTGGNTHAWVQVYVPGPGWIDFDPSSGTIGNENLVRVAVVHEPHEAIPLAGHVDRARVRPSGDEGRRQGRGGVTRMELFGRVASLAFDVAAAAPRGPRKVIHENPCGLRDRLRLPAADADDPAGQRASLAPGRPASRWDGMQDRSADPGQHLSRHLRQFLPRHPRARRPADALDGLPRAGQRRARCGRAPTRWRIMLEELPVDALIFLLGSRYCETDRLSDFAWSTFGHLPKGWPLVQAICDFAHERIKFGYEHASPTKTAFDAYTERRGVCRDYAHLAVTLCRCMNIPAMIRTERRPHHLHAHRLHAHLGRRAGLRARPHHVHLRRRVPAREAELLSQQEGRAGRARGHPSHLLRPRPGVDQAARIQGRAGALQARSGIASSRRR